ncbi:methyltransferase [Bacillus massilinigeriensis]|uniref:methyltransferase n=1 Tax=Bacillus massilionigeriensis TaxID=1805475 RepID=UPI00096AEFB6|nr:methyltransferase [Bacillus massilionigeriensis]
MSEQYYDDLMNIKTGESQKGFVQSIHYYRYEPTPYQALEELFKRYQLESSDYIVDFGCGKGRLIFFINYLFHANVVGIEMNKDLYKEALENRKSYLKKFRISEEKIQFYCGIAENYEISPFDNRFYFFNPFSIPIFMNIVNHILNSVEKYNRDIELILYYCSDDYIFFLENQTAFELKEEITLPGLFDHNPYERFLIYRLSN